MFGNDAKEVWCGKCKAHVFHCAHLEEAKKKLIYQCRPCGYMTTNPNSCSSCGSQNVEIYVPPADRIEKVEAEEFDDQKPVKIIFNCLKCAGKAMCTCPGGVNYFNENDSKAVADAMAVGHVMELSNKIRWNGGVLEQASFSHTDGHVEWAVVPDAEDG